MNNDFPRILSLLRKEKHLSQKQVAADLGVAQALLSHYEKGKRECGLEFLVKAADYYNVSTDYLLGRSPVSSGSVITDSDIPEVPANEKARNLDALELSAAFAKKLVTNSIDVIYSLLGKSKNINLMTQISNLLSLSVYRTFRLIYKTNSGNDKNLFKIPEEYAFSYINAGDAIMTANAIAAINEESADAPEISRTKLERDYQKQASVLLNTIMTCENQLKKLEL